MKMKIKFPLLNYIERNIGVNKEKYLTLIDEIGFFQF